MIWTLALIGLFTSTAQAEWRRYRITTHYGTPSVPVVREPVVVRDVFHPVVVSPAPVISYYSAPTVYFSPPATTARGTYYAPAPRTYFYSPPATYNRGVVILP